MENIYRSTNKQRLSFIVISYVLTDPLVQIKTTFSKNCLTQSISKLPAALNSTEQDCTC